MDSTCFPVRQAYFYVSQFFMRPGLGPPLSANRFLCLTFLCDHSLRFFLSAKPLFCFSVFYATAASAFPYPQSPFSVFLCFFPHHCLPFSYHRVHVCLL